MLWLAKSTEKRVSVVRLGIVCQVLPPSVERDTSPKAPTRHVVPPGSAVAS
jgi:hypothetical protein